MAKIEAKRGMILESLWQGKMIYRIAGKYENNVVLEVQDAKESIVMLTAETFKSMTECGVLTEKDIKKEAG